MTDLTRLDYATVRGMLKEKAISARELVSAYINRMDETRHLNAYITETPELALAQADETDARIAKGEMLPLDGAPLANKDLFCTKGVRTTAGSKILENFIPSYESTVTQRLKDAGAIMLGKTNLDEFAMGSSTITSYFGETVNPWQEKGNTALLTPGGSSGGSSAAVAAHSALIATGTDTGGSIRQPAALTGIVGLKPTYGLCSRWGTVSFASSLDQAGPMARTVRDTATMLEAMVGHDPKDSTSLPYKAPHYKSFLTKDVQGLRVGIPKEYRLDGAHPEVMAFWDRAVKQLAHAGAEIVEISLPHARYALPTYYIIAPAEASSNFARYDGVRYGLRVEGKTLDELYAQTREAGFGAEVKRRILVGTYVLSAGFYDAYFLRAQKVRNLVFRDFEAVFGQQVDVILCPSAPGPAFRYSDKPDPMQMYLEDVFTVAVNLAGLPGISVPVGCTASGLPVGMQFIGPSFGEPVILRAASFLEEASGFHEISHALRTE